MFASATLTEHVLRGFVGIGAFVGAVMLTPSYPVLSLFLLPVGLIALRGCPMCWTMGLFETIANKLKGRPTDPSLCIDGSCSRRVSSTDASLAPQARIGHELK